MPVAALVGFLVLGGVRLVAGLVLAIGLAGRPENQPLRPLGWWSLPPAASPGLTLLGLLLWVALAVAVWRLTRVSGGPR